MATKVLSSATAGSHLGSISLSTSPLKLRRLPYVCLHNSRIKLAITAASEDLQVPFPESHGHFVPQRLGADKSQYVSSTSIAPLTSPVSMKQWNLTDQHLFLLSTIAFLTGGAMTALFVSAIPTLLAFKRAAESLEKLLDVTREELPGTMAAVRLSGMEISDLTIELSELGQEISSGVKNSARAVRAAQDGLRRVSSMASTGPKGSPSRVSETRGDTSNQGSA